MPEKWPVCSPADEILNIWSVTMDHIYTLGIDIGSTASKCVMLADGKEIVAKSLISVGAGTSGPQRAISEVLEQAGKTKDEMAFVLATGYGRNSLEEIADAQMSELSCHAKGATFLFPQVHTVVDIGGQDVKILQVENGVMTNFVMNDKCAAGTGRQGAGGEGAGSGHAGRPVHQAGGDQLYLYGVCRERGHQPVVYGDG